MDVDGMYSCSVLKLLVSLQHVSPSFPMSNLSTAHFNLVPLASTPV